MLGQVNWGVFTIEGATKSPSTKSGSYIALSRFYASKYTVKFIHNQGETKVTNITGDIHIDENNVIEADSIEDIIAQFETDSSNNPTPSQSVSCPNCKKCFVSRHFLNLHLNNNTTVCDLCNKQTCSQVALRNHKNLECDLSKRKRNIDLIAKETALLSVMMSLTCLEQL